MSIVPNNHRLPDQALREPIQACSPGTAPTPAGVKTALRYNFLDSFLALNFAFLINAAILIMAAGTFYRAGYTQVAEIQDAYHTLAPLLGTQLAGILFAVALLCSGQNSTLRTRKTTKC